VTRGRWISAIPDADPDAEVVMSRVTLRRLAASVAASAGAVLATLALATPAHAADTVEVNLSGVSGTITAGTRGVDNLSATFVNRSNAAITSIQGVFTIHLDGMPADGVRIVRTLGSELPVQSAGDGTVRLTDPGSFELLRNGRRTLAYQLQFTATAPAGKAAITFEAYASGTRLGGDSASVTVKSSATPQPTSASPTAPANTDTGLVPTFTTAPNLVLGDSQDQNSISDEGGVPVSLYIMGGLLIAVGGVILWLLFRRQTPLADAGGYPTSEYDQVRPSSLGYPRHAATVHPTAVLPTVRDPEPPTLPGPPPPLPRRPY
jgi:hypothetical protein